MLGRPRNESVIFSDVFYKIDLYIIKKFFCKDILTEIKLNNSLKS